MSFNYIYQPPYPPGALFREGPLDRITFFNPSQARFAVSNWVGVASTIPVTLGVRIRTGPLTPPFNGVHIWTDSDAWGNVSATALPGYARGSVEATMRMLTLGGVEILRTAPVEFNGVSSATAPAFTGYGFGFSGVAYADGSTTASLSSDPVVIEVRITSWATAAGWAQAQADITNGGITQIQIASF